MPMIMLNFRFYLCKTEMWTAGPFFCEENRRAFLNVTNKFFCDGGRHSRVNEMHLSSSNNMNCNIETFHKHEVKVNKV